LYITSDSLKKCYNTLKTVFVWFQEINLKIRRRITILNQSHASEVCPSRDNLHIARKYAINGKKK